MEETKRLQSEMSFFSCRKNPALKKYMIPDPYETTN